MKHKVYVNGEPVEVGRAKITAEELLKLTGRTGDDYKLEHRDGDGGRTTGTFEGKDVIDLDEVCGAPRGPGPGEGGAPASTVAGPGEGGAPRGPGEGGPAQTPCYFTTAYTGTINPA